jgi:formate hydrogenlyase transcriptional activator
MVTSISPFCCAEAKLEAEGSLIGSSLIGSSQALSRVLSSARLVAPTDSTVLIQGETGTGKELIATLVHQASRRNRGPFLKLNCAAVPAGLLESELFGHERGAFTGALTQTTGRFQAAHNGTLFLDEIGDLPLELQPKLLRVLQEQEFERIGSNRAIRVDVRIIAATNQNLAELVNQRRFRPDLFYRLNVFPISLPPLRDRLEDISSLVRHFAVKFSKQMNKEVNYIPDSVIDVLRRHDWPGNIRELQNVIERAVILSPGPVLRLPLEELKLLAGPDRPSTLRTLADSERDHILGVLREVGWVVGGRRGAAQRLGVPRTTLMSKMQKLGILVGRGAASITSELDGGLVSELQAESVP